MHQLILKELWNTHKARWQEECGWEIPAAFSQARSEQAALNQDKALTDQSHRGKIRVSGSAAASFLNRMLTSDIQSLPPGTGQRSFLLSSQGKCLADFRIFKTPDYFFLDTEPGLAAEAIQLLDRYVITDDVSLTNITETWIHLSIDGSKAYQVSENLKKELPGSFIFDLPETASLSGLPAVHWLADESLSAEIIQAILKLHFPFCGHQSFNQTRLKHKIPRFRIDFDETWFLNETGLEETAASETKGCYPGQEVVARMKTYKKDVRRLFL